MNLDELINNYLTSGIKLADPEIIRKVKILNIFHIVFIMVAPLLGLFFFYIGAVLLFYSTVAAGLLMIVSVVLLRKTENLLYAGNYAIFILWAILLIISWNSGAVTYDGVIKPIWILNAGLILFSIFLNGYMSGTVWTTLVFIETGIVIYLFRNGYLFPNLIPPDISTTYALGTYMLALLAILMFAFLFEKEKLEALIREEGKTEALRESKKYLDDILERSPVPMFIIDRLHRVIQWNHACRELSGVPAGEVIGKDVWEGFYLDDRGSLADIIIDEPNAIHEQFGDGLVSQTESGLFEFNLLLPRLKDGQKVLTTVAPIMDGEGETKGAIQTIQEIKTPSFGNGSGNGDISQMECALAFSLFKIDRTGKITFWNETSRNIFGYQEDEILGKNAMSILSKRYRPPFKEMVSKIFKGETVPEKQFKFANKAGKPVYTLAQGHIVESEDNPEKECVIINTNITDLKMRGKKLEAYALETKEKFKILSEEYDLLKKNIATFIRKKDTPEDKSSE